MDSVFVLLLQHAQPMPTRNALRLIKSVAQFLGGGWLRGSNGVVDFVDVVALCLPLRAQYLCGFPKSSPWAKTR